MILIEKYDVDNSFEKNYLKARGKENRILTIEQIKQLPYLLNHSLTKEWQFRQKSTRRFLQYVQDKKSKNILDLGCGNGWLTYKLGTITEHVTAIDINKTELQQAAKVLSDFKNICLIYGNVFEVAISRRFDIIILNGSVQYFPNFSLLITRLFELLKVNGEIHILDSPFYLKKDLPQAKKRSDNYYDTINTSEMKSFYHHHNWEALSKFTYQILYNPKNIFQRISNKIGIKDSPFPWIKIIKS